MVFSYYTTVNWEENRESRISNSWKIPGPKIRELGSNTVYNIYL